MGFLPFVRDAAHEGRDSRNLAGIAEPSTIVLDPHPRRPEALTLHLRFSADAGAIIFFDALAETR
ncbi:hypothetical protein D3C78_1181370 [compost metagenome]